MKIATLIKKSVSNLDWFVFAYLGRRKWLRYTYKSMLTGFDTIKPLTDEQMSELKSIWGGYFKSKSFLIYNQYIQEGQKLSDYIPMEYFLFKLEPRLNKTFEGKYIDDKNLYDLYYPDIKQPNTIVRQVNGVLMDSNYNVISSKEAYKLAQSAGRIIIKIAQLSMGGHGIEFWEEKDGEESFYKKISFSENTIAQEFVKQHHILSSINRSSINTLRIATLMVGDHVHIVTKFLRMGSKGQLVDNVSSGGMYCGILDDGHLNECGYDHWGQPCREHPSGIRFKDIIVPGYEKCISIVKKLTPRMCNFSKLQSWDLCIGEDEEPILIEPNFEFPDLFVNQIACGPLLANDEVKHFLFNVANPHK